MMRIDYAICRNSEVYTAIIFLGFLDPVATDSGLSISSIIGKQEREGQVFLATIAQPECSGQRATQDKCIGRDVSFAYYLHSLRMGLL